MTLKLAYGFLLVKETVKNVINYKKVDTQEV